MKSTFVEARRPRPRGHGRPTCLQGFTLVEVVLVAVCMALIAIPLIEMLRAGTKSSLGGVVRVETTLEAQRILKQVQSDLKSACFPFNAGSMAGNGYALSQVVLSRQSGQISEYFFLSFPLQGAVEDYVRRTPTFSYRQPSLIHYQLQKNPTANTGSTLIREEIFHADHPLRKVGTGRRTQVLSDRVNIFRIALEEVTTTQPWVSLALCRVSLQLLETYRPPTENPSSPVPAAGFIIVDYYDVVYPEFLNTVRRQSFMNRSWQNWTDWKN